MQLKICQYEWDQQITRIANEDLEEEATNPFDNPIRKTIQCVHIMICVLKHEQTEWFIFSFEYLTERKILK